MKRYAVRERASGKYLSPAPSYGKRTWVSLPHAALWRNRSGLSNAMRHLTGKSFSINRSSWDKEYPYEVVEFNMFLIDEKIGTLAATGFLEQQ